MLSQPLTLNESVITGRDLTDVASPPILPLVDEDDEQTGVVSPPAAPPRCSTSVSSPPTPPCASTSSTDTCLTPMPTPLAPPLPLCPHPVSFHTSSLSPHPFSSAPSPTPSYSTSSTPPTYSHSAPFSVSSTSSTSLHDAPLPPPLYHLSPCLVSLPQPPPASAAFLTPHPSTSSSLSSSSVPPSLTAQPPAVSPLLPPPPPPCCPCASLLPRLLSAHRLEVRRLLRGALASLGRRLDSLERRSRRRRKKGRAHQRGACSSTSPSCSSTPIPPVTSPPSSLSSSASESEDSSTPPHSSCFLLSESDQRNRRRRSEDKEEEELRGRKRKRRRKNRREDFHFTGNRVADQEEDSGRFVGRMLVSFRGGGTEDEAPLTLHNFNHRKHMTMDQAAATSQSEKAVSTITKQNGYRKHLLMHNVSASSHDSLHRVQTCSQPEVLDLSNGQWSFSAFTPPLSFSPNHSALHLWLCSSSTSSSSINPALMLRMSTVAVETVSESVRGEAYECPLRPLKDWTAPPSLKSDHCYIQTSAPSPTFSARRQQKQRSNHSARSLHLPRRRPLPLPPCPANGLSTPFPASQSTASAEFSSTSGECVKRVSQIRIRRASPRETPLTPMGLPKIKRLKKKEFSLEEIYTNKNYKSPTTNRSLETIYEEPREKDGALLLIGQQRRRRLLLFPDFTQPRKRKRPQGAGFPVVMAPRKRAAARRHCHGNSDDDADLDVMLVERLSALEDFLTRQGLDV